jgi:LacI family transcriptional regulator
MAHTTLKTIAEYTGLSVTTVSRALKNGDDVKEPTKQKVREAAHKLGYAPNLQGLGLRTGRNYTICCVIPVMNEADTVGDIGSLSLLSGITRGLENTPYHMSVIPIEPSQDPIDPIKYIVESNLAGGIIINNTKPNDPRVTYLHEHNFPFITFGQTEMSIEHAFVDVDNFDAGFRAAEYLYKQGCKRIRMVTAVRDYTYVWHKYYGVKRAAMEYGFDFSDDSLIYDSDVKDYRTFARKIFAQEDYPDGVFCGSSINALGMIAGATDNHLVIGKDVKIICIESCALPTQFIPPVPGLRQDLIDIGMKLSQGLLKVIDGEDVKKLQLIEKVKFIDR